MRAFEYIASVFDINRLFEIAFKPIENVKS